MLSKYVWIILVSLGCLAGCGEKKAGESAAMVEEKRRLMRSADEAATSLASLGRHDKKYYLDRIAEILSGCTRDGNLDMSCLNRGLEALRHE